ncbi:MAG: hypothetical protein PVI86_08215 [Phycisphaerae bacterium]
MMYSRARLATVVVGLSLPSLALAGQLPRQFTLGNYIPGDVWMYTHVVQNPERRWLDAEWGDVFAALKASGADQDVVALVLDVLGDSLGPRTFNADERETWKQLFRNVKWGELFASEFAFAERLGTEPVHLDYILLARTTPEKAAGNAKALAAILDQLALSLNARIDKNPGAQGFAVEHYKVHGVKVASMCLGAAEGFPIKSVELFHEDGVVGITTRREAVKQIVGLMVDRPVKRSIVDMPRFEKAISRVAAPEDSVAFFDFKRLIMNIDRLVGTAVQHVKDGEKGTVGKARAVARFIDLINVMDSLVITGETRGRREFRHSVVQIQQSKTKCALACCFMNRRPFERFDEFVPVDAVGFSVDGFLDIEALYRFLTDFVEKELPDGPELIAKLNKTYARFGFDPHRDLFSWWSGEMVTVSLPGTGSGPLAGKEWVWMARVKDTELAARKLDAGLKFTADFLHGVGQMVMLMPAPVDAPGFKEVTHPVMLAFVRPVIGVEGDWLMVGSSAGAINKCLAVSSGKARSIRKNKRFQEEGLIPKGPVLSASFKDTTGCGDELAGAAALVGMMGMGLATHAGEKDADAQEFIDFFQRVVAIAAKLPPVLQNIDFYRSQSSIQTYEGEGIIRGEQVITYRPPLPGERDAATTRPR